MKNKLKKLRESITEIIATALTFLCLGIIVQLLINNTILGWDPVGNVKSGGNAFIGVIAIVLLYILFIRKK
ncbi:MAG: hypothetical protein HOA52_00390 [Flavobacteriales bacterium]|jgi:hypothetical protein|nr:hypothetical protein [Flavobacteriales bacterium]MBT6807930.1 hypothetical protein [Flavobacteriales bacterium]